MADERFHLPSDVSRTDAATGASSTRELLPSWETIPEEFRASGRGASSPWVAFVERWFFEGADGKLLVARQGIDRGQALRHLAAAMRSFAPRHEHKIAGVAWLCSLWFEPLGGSHG